MVVLVVVGMVVAGTGVEGDIEQDKEVDLQEAVDNTDEVVEGTGVDDNELVVEDKVLVVQDCSFVGWDIVDWGQAFVNVVCHQLGRVET